MYFPPTIGYLAFSIGEKLNIVNSNISILYIIL